MYSNIKVDSQYDVVHNNDLVQESMAMQWFPILNWRPDFGILDFTKWQTF